MRIALVGPSRFGLGEPFAGGLEAHTATLAQSLHAAGHDVTVFAGPTAAPHALHVQVVPIVDRTPDGVRRLDTDNPPWFARHEDDAYEQVAQQVFEPGRFDVVHNNSLHRRLVDADPTSTPIVHTLHCPPFDRLADAHQQLRTRHPDRTVIAVSAGLAATWSDAATGVIHNGVDLDHWQPVGRTRDETDGLCAWAGRIIADKAPHLAIDAATQAGHRVVIAGPVQDAGYFETEIRPRLRAPTVQWIGPADTATLRQLYSNADVGLVTPVWDEPFGLVAAEMLACGLPVAGFDTGAICEFTDVAVTALAQPGNSDALATAISEARELDRAACRRWAVERLSIQAMTNSYVDAYNARTSSVP